MRSMKSRIKLELIIMVRLWYAIAGELDKHNDDAMTFYDKWATQYEDDEMKSMIE